MNPSAGYRWLNLALFLIALFAASLMLWRATDASCVRLFIKASCAR
jgi:hypothetical protein